MVHGGVAFSTNDLRFGQVWVESTLNQKQHLQGLCNFVSCPMLFEAFALLQCNHLDMAIGNITNSFRHPLSECVGAWVRELHELRACVLACMQGWVHECVNA